MGPDSARLTVVMTIGWALDPILFPKLRRTKVVSPIVLVGNPRTGTKVSVTEKYVPFFKTGKELRDRLNQADG